MKGLFFLTEVIFFVMVITSIHSPYLNVSEHKNSEGDSYIEIDDLTGFFSFANNIVVAGIILSTNENDMRTIKIEVLDSNFHLLFFKRINIPSLPGFNNIYGEVTEFRETNDKKYLLTVFVKYMNKSTTDSPYSFYLFIFRASQDLDLIDFLSFNIPQITDNNYIKLVTFVVDLTFSQQIYRVFYTDFWAVVPWDSQILHFIDIDISSFKIIVFSKITEICCISPAVTAEVKWIYFEKEIQKYYFLILQAYSKLLQKNYTVIFKNDSYGIEPNEVSFLPNYDYNNLFIKHSSTSIFLSSLDTITFTCTNGNEQYFYGSSLFKLSPILKYTIHIPSLLTENNKSGDTYMKDGKIYSTIFSTKDHKCLLYSFDDSQVVNSYTPDNFVLFPDQSKLKPDHCEEAYNIKSFNSSHFIFFEKGTRFDINPGSVNKFLKINFFKIQDLQIQTSKILGGKYGNRDTKIFTNFTNSSLLYYGKGNIGIYLKQINKTNPLTIINHNRLDLEGYINSYFVVKADQKIILIGNYMKENLQIYPFIAEIDEFLFPEIINPPSWGNYFEISNAINLDPTKFAVVGTKIHQSNSNCYYAEVNGKYSLSNENVISIEGKTCKVNAIIQSQDLKIIGVGEVSGDSTVILFQFRPILLYYIVKNYRNVSLNSISQYNSSNFIASGIITDNMFDYPYYIIFNYNLIPSSDINILKYKSRNSNLIQISKNLIISANLCDTPGCLRLLSFISFFTIANRYDFSLSTLVDYPFSLGLNDNKAILIYATNRTRIQETDPYFYFSKYTILKLNLSCPESNILNNNDGMCYFDCMSPELIDYYLCLEYDDKICINCQLMSNSLITDLFDPSEYFLSDTKMILIKDSIDFNKEENMISFKFNNIAIYYPFSIIISLMTIEGNFTTYVKYEYYRIDGKSVKIMNLTLPNNLNELLLTIDLTFLKIFNPFGVPLINPILTLDLSEFFEKKESLFTKIIDASSSFITNNQFFNTEIQSIQE